MDYLPHGRRYVRIVAVMLLAGAGTARAGEFPAVEDLPSRPRLTDPFTMNDGRKVSTPAEWYERRRPELKGLFQHYMYGEMPPAAKIRATVTKTEAGVFGGKAVLKEIEIAFPELAGKSKGASRSGRTSMKSSGGGSPKPTLSTK